MKRNVLWLLSSVSVLVLLFSYHTSTSRSFAVGGATAPIISSSGGASGGGPAPTPSSMTSGGTTPSTPSTPTTPTTPTTPRTLTGVAAPTRYGPVQVQVTVSGRTITAVAVPVYPTEGSTDREINSQALPILVSETTAAQSAHIDMVSGATYTSRGYARSLQSALDQAGR